MRIDVVTIFPEMVEAVLATGMLRKAREAGLAELRAVDLREYAEGPHRMTDDAAFGGEGGQVMKVEPMVRAVEALRGPGSRVVLLSPAGRRFDQRMAWEYVGVPHLILLCGRYEGVDERVRQLVVDEELSVGDYVLSGGELAALVVVDAVVRLLPGVLNRPGAARDDSFSSGLLEGPQYTRPRLFRGLAVPEVLLSGDHGAIRRWRRKEALRRTLLRRPDLLARAELDAEDRELLAEVLREQGRML
ncbi:MAG: tRNA (guanosine(37)-N1)-methyltransferase TrmD [Firmicutes bacterium]|nr:tRNA (guanosine(37)-N1)-methyltransferase TrmD [Bacillota bacterium]